MRILVVEDNAVIAMVICDALQEAGYEVIGPTDTASKGLELARTKRPDLALLNVDLADEIKGTHLARILASLFGTPVLFVSGNIDEAQTAKDVALGYISKPCLPSTVVESVELAKAITRGTVPQRIPEGLTLFGA